MSDSETNIEQLQKQLIESIDHYDRAIVSYEKCKSDYHRLKGTYERWVLEKERNRRMERFVWIPIGLNFVVLFALVNITVMTVLLGFNPFSHLKNATNTAIPAIKSETMDTPAESSASTANRL